ncbi:unnamed protein product [Rodentolepis nana]|uniref:DUF1540 domain-containing protein n=1 Tax=Rodentolepis nana TaxID=102285 RepID=A0A0R3TZ66_RODNA|nr:unnamed protein product [Rodentolepis nana]
MSGMGHVIGNCRMMNSADCDCGRELGQEMIQVGGEHIPHESDIDDILCDVARNPLCASLLNSSGVRVCVQVQHSCKLVNWMN